MKEELAALRQKAKQDFGAYLSGVKQPSFEMPDFSFAQSPMSKMVRRPTSNSSKAKRQIKALKAKKQAIEAVKGSKHKKIVRQSTNLLSLFLQGSGARFLQRKDTKDAFNSLVHSPARLKSLK